MVDGNAHRVTVAHARARVTEQAFNCKPEPLYVVVCADCIALARIKAL